MKYEDEQVEFPEKVVIPGENLTKECVSAVKDDKIKLGPGLRQTGNDIIACMSEILKTKSPNFFWVECYQKRYIPVKGENVLGIVSGKAGDAFKVDIGSSDQVIFLLM